MHSASSISLDEIINMAIRRRWIILIPLFIATVFGIYIAVTTPKTYEASTLVIVQPQKVPKDFVRPAVAENVEAMLGTISQLVKSRTNLERIVNDFGMMSRNRRAEEMEDIVDGLRNNISINVRRDRKGSDIFWISYRGKDPQRVADITNALATNFIDSTTMERELQASETSSFLDDELKNIRKRLHEMEAEIKDYRQQYMGELPEQLGSNLARLQGLQNQLTAKEASLREIKLRIAELESQPTVATGDSLNPNDTENLEAKLAELLMRYTENHPDVTRLKRRIEELKRQGGNAGAGIQTGSSRRTDELTRDKMALERQIALLNSQIQTFQRRVEETPKREQELISLKRDYDNMSNLYSSLEKRKLESEISVNMEMDKKGEQFQIIDSALPPKTPIEPNLQKIFLLTLGVGLAFGCGLAYLLEFLDSSYRNPENVEQDFKIPVIATIPAIYPLKAVFKKRIEMGLCGLFALVILVLIGAFSYATLWGSEQTLNVFRDYISLL
jgi:polysaccharide chain length determinant protein (PEP-CTERM system associated)